MSVISKFVGRVKEKGIKHIIIYTIPTKVLIIITSLFNSIGYKIYRNKPLQDVIVIESHNDFDSNGGAFYDYLISNGYNMKYKIVWFLRNACPKNLPDNVEGYRYNRPSLKRIYYHCVAKYILCEHFTIPAIREGQTSYFLRHGAGGLKKVLDYFKLPAGIKYILGMSESYAPIENLKVFFSNDNQQIIYTGFPSHDYLFKDNANEIKKVTVESYKKTILWMPTFRKAIGNRNDIESEQPLGIPLLYSIDEYNELNDFLMETGSLLIIKIHPMQDLYNLEISDRSNIKVLTGEKIKELEIDNYRLMSCVDAMISDYSGAAYDYLQLNRPISYVLSDMHEYKLGFVVDDIHELIAGHEIYTLNDMRCFIKDVVEDKDPYKKKRESLRDFIYTYHDANNSKRLAEFMNI